MSHNFSELILNEDCISIVRGCDNCDNISQLAENINNPALPQNDTPCQIEINSTDNNVTVDKSAQNENIEKLKKVESIRISYPDIIDAKVFTIYLP